MKSLTLAYPILSLIAFTVFSIPLIAEEKARESETIFDERKWTSADESSSFTGTLTELKSGKVSILKEGETITFSTEKLSLADREFLAQGVSLTTLDGKTHENVSASRIAPDSIMFSKPSGVVTIAMENLPEKMRIRFGFDPEKAKAARIAQAAMQAEQRSRMAAQQNAQNEKLALEAQLAKAELRDAFVYRFVDGGMIFHSHTYQDYKDDRAVFVVPGTGRGYKQILDARDRNTQFHLTGVPKTPALVDDQPFSAYMIPNGTYEMGGSRIKSFKFLKWGGILHAEDQKFDTPTVVRKVD